MYQDMNATMALINLQSETVREFIMNILLIDGHPDVSDKRFCRAIVAAYEKGASDAGHDTRRIEIAKLTFPILRSEAEFEGEDITDTIQAAQDHIKWAKHIVGVYPLWLGTMPALLKAFLEQVFRPGFGIGSTSKGWPEKLLKGRSARIIVTMGMPAFIYRWYFSAHSLKSLERNILKFCGITPVRETILGMVTAVTDEKRKSWLNKIERLGANCR